MGHVEVMLPDRAVLLPGRQGQQLPSMKNFKAGIFRIGNISAFSLWPQSNRAGTGCQRSKALVDGCRHDVAMTYEDGSSG
jgi:hypothetical protein